MNGFTDLQVAFGSAHPPTRTRLGNRWQSLDESIPGIWIGMSASSAGPPVTVANARGWRVWAMGDLFGYRSHAANVLQRFVDDLASEASEPARLDLHGLVVAWEEGPRRLHVWTNRLGTVHAYRSGVPGCASLGTFMPAVAEVSRGEPDWIGITGFCGFGFYPGDRTMLDDLRILRPATSTVFDERGSICSERRYWDWTYDPDPTRSDVDFIDEFHDIWVRTLAEQGGDHSLVIPMSGGLDSRTLLAGAVPAGTSPDNIQALTYGYSPSSVEIAIGRKAAAARGIRAEEWVVAPYLFDRLDEVVDALEGFSSLTMPRQVGTSDLIARLGQRVVGGHWGDVWFDTSGAFDAGQTAISKNLVDLGVSTFAKLGREWLLSKLCAPHLDGEPEGILRDLVADELARIPDLGDPDMTLKALKTETWSFRWTITSMRAYQLALPTLLPFYGNEVVDFFLRVPTERLVERRLQVAYLQRYHQDLARIRWQQSGMSLNQRPWEPTMDLARRALAKGIRAIRHRPAMERNWEIQFLNPKGLDALKKRLLVGEYQYLDPTDIGFALRQFADQRSPESAHIVDSLLALKTIPLDCSNVSPS